MPPTALGSEELDDVATTHLEGRTRTMTTTYDYRGWDEPVDVTP